MARETAARQAVHDSLRRLRRDLRNAIDPRVWVRNHPWLAVITAAAAGFVMSDNLRPRQPQPQNPQPSAASSAPPGTAPEPASAASSQPSLRSTISHEILAVIRPILVAAVTQHLKNTLFADIPPGPTTPPGERPPTV